MSRPDGEMEPEFVGRDPETVNIDSPGILDTQLVVGWIVGASGMNQLSGDDSNNIETVANAYDWLKRAKDFGGRGEDGRTRAARNAKDPVSIAQKYSAKGSTGRERFGNAARERESMIRGGWADEDGPNSRRGRGRTGDGDDGPDARRARAWQRAARVYRVIRHIPGIPG